MKRKNQLSDEISSPPLAEEIARRAYAYWEADGRQDGAAMRHWLRAETEVLTERGLPLPAPNDDGDGAVPGGGS